MSSRAQSGQDRLQEGARASRVPTRGRWLGYASGSASRKNNGANAARRSVVGVGRADVVVAAAARRTPKNGRPAVGGMARNGAGGRSMLANCRRRRRRAFAARHKSHGQQKHTHTHARTHTHGRHKLRHQQQLDNNEKGQVLKGNNSFIVQQCLIISIFFDE